MNFVTKKNGIRLGIVVIIVLLVVMMGKYYTSSVAKLLEENNIALLDEISEQSSTVVLTKLEQDGTSLEFLADIVGYAPTLFDEKNIALLQEYAKEKGYIRLFLTDMQGNIQSSDGLKEQGARKDVISFVQQEGFVVSDVVLSDRDDQKKVISLSAPVLKNGTMIGAVTLVCDTEEYADEIEVPLFGGTSKNYILKSTGEAVILPKEEQPLFAFDSTTNFTEGNFFEDIPELSILPEEMAEGNRGTVIFIEDGGGEAYVAYRPLGINDWYILSVIPANVFNTWSQSIGKIVMGVSIFTGIVIIALAVLVIWFYRSQGKTAQEIAYVDGITKLPNRQKMKQEYEKQIPEGRGLAFAVIGVKDFAIFHKIFGYQAGGQLLKDMSKEIQSLLRGEEKIARLKEDRFGLFLKVAGKEDAKNRLEQILAKLQTIKIVDGESVYAYTISYPCGVTLLEGKETFDTVVEHAMLALKTAERKNTKEIYFFDTALQETLDLQKELMADMYRALKNREFTPYFQLQYDTEHKDFVCGEVLARWKHPTRGILLPGTFLPVLEKAGLTLELDMIMLEEACKEQRLWIDKGLVPIPLSINISRLNIHKIDFVDRIKQIVERYHISPSLLALELTESAISDNMDRVLGLIQELKAYGFVLSIDNFGSGDSSLNLLRQISVDTIKLDRRFFPTTDITEKDGIVVKNIIRTAKELDIAVVAEGIETEEQGAFLEKVGCSQAQGFLYSKPMPKEEFETIVFREEEL